jgi:hypothetical protein
MKKILILSISFALHTRIHAQQSTVNIAKYFSQMNAVSMRLFKFDRSNDCDQSKAVSILYENKVSKCFTYLEDFKVDKVDTITASLMDTATYGNVDMACFDTDYGMVFYDSRETIVGYINISFSCNKLIANPKISERDIFITESARKVGFSDKGRKKLLALLRF